MNIEHKKHKCIILNIPWNKARLDCILPKGHTIYLESGLDRLCKFWEFPRNRHICSYMCLSGNPGKPIVLIVLLWS